MVDAYAAAAGVDIAGVDYHRTRALMVGADAAAIVRHNPGDCDIQIARAAVSCRYRVVSTATSVHEPA